MTLIELKEYITNGTMPSDFLILVNKDNQFLATQYIQAIGNLAAGGLNKVKSIYEPQQSSFALLTANDDAVNVVYTETFDERAEDYSSFENTIVVCEQIEKSIAPAVEKYTIKLPKFEDWQIYDYVKTLCPTIDEEDLMWLIKATDNNIERVLNELDKVSIFNKNEQKAIFSAVRLDAQKDLYKADLFAIVNALVNGDMPVLFEFMKYGGYESIEPVVLANRTFSSLRNIILISQNHELTAEDCGVTPGQYKYIKYNYRSVNVNAIRQKIKFLTNFDLDLKTSKLDMSKQDMLNYLINNLAYKIIN